MNYRIIGVGNEFRSDDGIGLQIVRELKKSYPQLTISECDGNGVELLSLFQGNDLLIITDAAFTQQDEKVGDIIQLKLDETVNLSDYNVYSSHSFGLIEALRLGKVLNIIPNETFLYLVLAKNFSYGNSISEQVKKSIEKIISLIIKNHFHYIIKEV